MQDPILLLAAAPEIRRIPATERQQAIEEARYLTFRARANNVRWVASMACLVVLASAVNAAIMLVASSVLGGIASLCVWLIGFNPYQWHYWRLLRPELSRIVRQRAQAA